jgi:hypothetical protein
LTLAVPAIGNNQSGLIGLLINNFSFVREMPVGIHLGNILLKGRAY